MTLEELKYGDLNGDGEINRDDIEVMIQYWNEELELTEEQKILADLNGDGQVDVMDIALMIQYYNNVINRFPVEINEAKSMSGGE